MENRWLGRAQARWGGRPAGGTLYTGTATIAVTWRRPPTHPRSPPPPPPPPARARRPPPRPLPRRAPRRPLPPPPPGPSAAGRPRGGRAAAGGRQVGGRAPPAAGVLLCVSPRRLRAGWHWRPATPTQDPGRTREPHTPLTGPGPSFLCFPDLPSYPHPPPPKEKSEAPAPGPAFSSGSDRGGCPWPGASLGLGFLKSPPQRKAGCVAFVRTRAGRRGSLAAPGLGARRALSPAPTAPAPFPSHSLCCFLCFFELQHRPGCASSGAHLGAYPGSASSRGVREPPAGRGLAARTPRATGCRSRRSFRPRPADRGGEATAHPEGRPTPSSLKSAAGLSPPALAPRPYAGNRNPLE